MVTARDDSREKLTHALTLIEQGLYTSIDAMRTQHLNGAIRLIEMVRDSIEGESAFKDAIGERPN
jgi:hypothetical protein